MGDSVRKYRLIVILTLFCFFFSSPGVNASASSENESLDIKSLIFDHITNAHDWHIASYKGTHISIPLPVILYSQERGWFLFMSSKFHHGSHPYKGFTLHTEGEYKGSITEKNRAGEITKPLDLSLSKHVVSMILSLILMSWLFLSIAKRYKKDPLGVPRGKQSLLEPIILFVKNDIALDSIGEKNHEKFLPFLLSIFFFILFNNLMGLIPIFPGGSNVTGDIGVTATLALFTFIMIQVHGNKDYWKHIFNTPGIPWFLKLPIPIVPVIEFVGIFIKPFTLMIRLFANITAGHMIVLAFFSLIFIFGQFHAAIGYSTSLLSLVFTLFMTTLEILVAFIQAFVFTLLSAIFIGMATVEHEAHH